MSNWYKNAQNYYVSVAPNNSQSTPDCKEIIVWELGPNNKIMHKKQPVNGLRQFLSRFNYNVPHTYSGYIDSCSKKCVITPPSKHSLKNNLVEMSRFIAIELQKLFGMLSFMLESKTANLNQEIKIAEEKEN